MTAAVSTNVAPLGQSRVPAGKLERLARFGWLAGEVAVGGIVESARRLATGVSNPTSALLTTANAERLAKQLSAMRGAAMKLGQLLSMEGDDLLPPQFAAAIAVLQAEGTGMPETQLRRVLGSAWGHGWEPRFREFDLAPMAAASIGQVHRAVDRKGRKLAIKVQFPGVSRSISSDVDNLGTILRLSGLVPKGIDLRPLLRETKRQLRAETDYRAESEQLRRYASLVAGVPRLVVPGVVDELCTDHVLAMDLLEGEPLPRFFGQDRPQRVRDQIGRDLYSLFFRELLDFRFMQTDPNPANYLVLGGNRIGLLDFGAARAIDPALSEAYRDIFAGGMSEDRGRMRRGMEAAGFFRAGDDERRTESIIDVFALGCEPFRKRGLYDFAESDLPGRIRNFVLELAMSKSLDNAPHPEVLFLQRKVGGVFMLCARLGARVNTRALLMRTLEESSPPPTQ
jgi:predicted unusual protein kinase regulating ubiquinone biosynthesis (AarF/ABC1/UbiB family)